jgi:hypothetical protein
VQANAATASALKKNILPFNIILSLLNSSWQVYRDYLSWLTL